MRIALVDDDVDLLAQTARTLALILEERGMSADVRTFASAEELSASLNHEVPFDLYLLDVIMPGQDGIALGNWLRRNQPDVPILFFTTSRDFAVEAFALEATDYVMKPFTCEAFAHALDRAFRRLPRSRPAVLVLKDSNAVVRIPLADIVFTESADHYQVVKTLNGQSHVVRITLQDLFDKFQGDDRFVRIGRQGIVNLAHVVRFSGNAMILSDGNSIPVPRRNLAEVKAVFMRYYIS